MHAIEVTELLDYVGYGTFGRHGTGSLKQHSGPNQDSTSNQSIIAYFYIILR